MPTLDKLPAAVPDLAIAAELLGVPLHDVKEAAKMTTTYPHADGRPMWSIAQLQRRLAGKIEKKAKARPRTMFLSRDDAEAAAVQAETTDFATVAASYGRSVQALVGAWKRYGIERPARKRATRIDSPGL
jgi:hypothetical protein